MQANSQHNDLAGIKEFCSYCLGKWHLFATTVALALLVAFFMIAATAPMYKSNACLVIKQDRRTGGSGIESAANSFSNMGSLFYQQTNVFNEILAFQSPTLMTDVVRMMDLRADYKVREKLHYKTLYGSSLPVSVTFLDLPEDKTVGLTLNYSDAAGVTLTKMFNFIGGKKILYEEPLYVAFQDTVQTVVGRLCVTAKPSWLSAARPFKPILMEYSSVTAAQSRYSAGLNVEIASKDATAIALSIQDRNAERARDVLSCLIDAYNAKWIGDRNKIAVSTSEFITERLSAIEKELGSVDSNISDFKARNLILDPQAAGNMYMNQASRIQTEIFDLNNRRNVSQYIRDYLVNSRNDNKLLPANSGMDNSTIETQISEFNTTQLQRNNLVANSSEQNPVVVKMDLNLEAMRNSILESIDNYIIILGKQIASLERTEAQNTRRITDSPRQVERLTDIERQQKVKESLYLYLLQKREENELSQAFTAYNTRIIAEPVLKKAPVSPNPMRIVLIALLIGFAIPVALIYVFVTANTKLRSRKDLEGLSLPFVGEIPLAYKPGRLEFLIPVSRRKGRDMKVVVEPHNRNIVNEAFRVVRSNLEFICSDEKRNVIQMTSFNPGSGKTFISANLCSALALKGQKVCSVDLDMRRAQLSSYISSPEKGVADYLASSSGEDLNGIIVRNPLIEGWDVIPVGTIPPNPSELLYSDRLKQMIDELGKRYDYVFLDCPPVEIVADPTIINRHVDRTMFVVRAGLLDRDLLPEIDKLYRENKFRRMMLIMNGTGADGDFTYGTYRYGSKYSSSYYSKQ